MLIATRYGPSGLGILSRFPVVAGGGARFSHLSRPALGPTQPTVQWVPNFFPGVKRLGRGVDHHPPTSAEGKERVQLYLYSPSGLSWSTLGSLCFYIKQTMQKKSLYRYPTSSVRYVAFPPAHTIMQVLLTTRPPFSICDKGFMMWLFLRCILLRSGDGTA